MEQVSGWMGVLPDGPSSGSAPVDVLQRGQAAAGHLLGSLTRLCSTFSSVLEHFPHWTVMEEVGTDPEGPGRTQKVPDGLWPPREEQMLVGLLGDAGCWSPAPQLGARLDQDLYRN